MQFVPTLLKEIYLTKCSDERNYKLSCFQNYFYKHGVTGVALLAEFLELPMLYMCYA